MIVIVRRAFLLWIDARTVLAYAIANINDALTSLLGLSWRPPTPGRKVIHPTWLSHILGRTVHSVTLKPLDENRGFIGSMLRVEIRCDDMSTSSLILKTSFPQSRRNLVIGAGGVREGIFYRSRYSHRLQDVGRVPKAFYSYGSHVRGQYVLLMEDLRHCSPVNHLFGNQIWGVPEDNNHSTQKQVDPLDLLHAMYMHAAEMHAQYWNDEKLLQCTWMRSSEWFHGRGKMIWELSMNVAKTGWERLRNSPEMKYPKDFSEILDRSFQALSWEHVRGHLKSSPFTLTHGDYHAANMMIDLSKETLLEGLKVFDWSEVGPWEPTTDLAQPVVSDLSLHLFPKVKSVLQSYHEQLVRLGVEDYSWEDCQRRFGESGMERWIWVLGVMACLPCPTALYQYFVNQMNAFRLEFCPNHPLFQLKTCGYILPNTLPT